MKKEAVLLLNMGGPNNLDEVEVFLKNMFNDPNILTMKSSLLRKFVAFMITASRKNASKEIYRSLGGKSPIVDLTKTIVQKLQQKMDEETVVDFVMRYTPPFADNVIRRLQREGIQKVYLIPMYPQYSTTTTKSSFEDFSDTAKRLKFDAEVVHVDDYYENEKYNQAVIERIKETLQDAKCGEYELIFSAHGLPQKIVDAGDVYEKHITKNVAKLQKMMQKEAMAFSGVYLAYQSKVGPMKWLEPSLEDVLKSMAGKKVIIYPIAFTVDNSETDFELAVEYEHIAKEIGIEEYKVCRCVNDHPVFIEALFELYEALK